MTKCLQCKNKTLRTETSADGKYILQFCPFSGFKTKVEKQFTEKVEKYMKKRKVLMERLAEQKEVNYGHINTNKNII